mmetsp:Transcript_115157/g.215598  ORF Transcript_115157/g.215598 Transcript_115157/m.215598 type:complete len:203 (+) Transcript_115157:1019-1627(+)
MRSGQCRSKARSEGAARRTPVSRKIDGHHAHVTQGLSSGLQTRLGDELRPKRGAGPVTASSCSRSRSSGFCRRCRYSIEKVLHCTVGVVESSSQGLNHFRSFEAHRHEGCNHSLRLILTSRSRGHVGSWSCSWRCRWRSCRGSCRHCRSCRGRCRRRSLSWPLGCHCDEFAGLVAQIAHNLVVLQNLSLVDESQFLSNFWSQ